MPENKSLAAASEGAGADSLVGGEVDDGAEGEGLSSLGELEGEADGEPFSEEGVGAFLGWPAGEGALTVGLLGAGEGDGDDAATTASISSFIPWLQWPAVPQMKYLFPGEVMEMTVSPPLYLPQRAWHES